MTAGHQWMQRFTDEIENSRPAGLSWPRARRTRWSSTARPGSGRPRSGARREAVGLGEHAFRLTPAGSAGRPERLLALAEYLETAGEADRQK